VFLIFQAANYSSSSSAPASRVTVHPGCGRYRDKWLPIVCIFEEIEDDECGYVYSVAVKGHDVAVSVPASAFDLMGKQTLEKQHPNASARSAYWLQKVDQDDLRAMDSGDDDDSDAAKPAARSKPHGAKRKRSRNRRKVIDRRTAR